MRCWKCEKETEDGSPECAECALAAEHATLRLELLGETGKGAYELDWDAIKTIEDLRLVVKTLGIMVVIQPHGPLPDNIRPFMRARSKP